MKSVWKFELSPYLPSLVPVGAEILYVAEQFNKPCLWALVDPQAPRESRQFQMAGTGVDLFNPPGRYLGTAMLDGGARVVHVFDPTPAEMAGT